MPTSPSVPPVTGLSWSAAVAVSSPTASVTIRHTTPRVRTTASPTTAEKAAAVAAAASSCTGPMVWPARATRPAV
jgi:hypothetical protein